MTYEIEWLQPAVDELLALGTKKLQKQVTRAVKSLEIDPRPRAPTGRQLSREWAGYWRLRTGEYRVIYRVDDGSKTVTVAKVGHRREVY